eukprot:gene10465-2987_t
MSEAYKEARQRFIDCVIRESECIKEGGSFVDCIKTGFSFLLFKTLF